MSHDEAATEVPESKRRKVDQAHLNMDCLEMIFRYLDYVALVKLSRTCRTWNSVAGYVLQRQRKMVLMDLFVPWKKIYSLSDKHFVVIFKGKSELSELDISVPYDSEKRSSKFLPQGLLKAVMEHCPNITKLYARDVIWDLKPALSFFAGLPHLTHLYLDYSSLTDPILDVILANCNSLVHLDVSGTTCITRESYKMHTANNLTSLKADYCPECQFGMSDILDSISRLFPKLETLDISGYMEIGEYFEDIFRRDFIYLHGYAMSSLKMLSLKDTEVINKEDEEMGSAENQEEECNEEDSAEEGEENEGDSDSKDDVTNMQLAWEMLELSRIIFARQDTKEMKMKQAEANLALGEIGMELEHYPEAIGDFMECLRLQEQILQPDDRLLAETFYNLGLAYSFDRHYGKAIEYYNKAITVIKLRINNLKEQMKEKDDTNATELNDLEELIPDIAAKVEDAEYMKRTTEDIIKTAANIAKESLGESSVFGAPISAFDASASAFDVPNSAFDAPASGFDAPNSAFDAPVSGFDAPNSGFDAPVSTENTKEPDVKVTNICHLVRKKRKTDDESGGSKKARPNEDQGKEE